MRPRRSVSSPTAGPSMIEMSPSAPSRAAHSPWLGWTNPHAEEVDA
jgi:hypothetical protein